MTLFRRDDPGFIGHLKAEVDFWRAQCLHERGRAEHFITELLRERNPAVQAAAPYVPPVKEETPEELAQRLMRQAEFTEAGA